MANRRIWTMPNSETFRMGPVMELLDEWLERPGVIVDPFARNSMWGTHRNDLNPSTSATWHLPALKFAEALEAMAGVVPFKADCVLFDPPYSLEQAKRSYQGAGVDFTYADTLNAVRWSKEKDAFSRLIRVGGQAITFGWDSCGFGKSRGFELVDLVLLCHGPGHHDTIITREIKVNEQAELLEEEAS